MTFHAALRALPLEARPSIAKPRFGGVFVYEADLRCHAFGRVNVWIP